MNKDEVKEFRKEFEDFITYWEKEIEEIKQRAISPEDASGILLSHINARGIITMGFPEDKEIMNWSDVRRLEHLLVKLTNSLFKARSNYRLLHRTLLERFADGFANMVRRH